MNEIIVMIRIDLLDEGERCRSQMRLCLLERIENTAKTLHIFTRKQKNKPERKKEIYSKQKVENQSDDDQRVERETNIGK